MPGLIISIAIIILVVILIILLQIIKIRNNKKYKELEEVVLKELGFSDWNIVPFFDENVTVKSRQTLDKYDGIRFFKENNDKLIYAYESIKMKNKIKNKFIDFLKSNTHIEHSQYKKIVNKIISVKKNTEAYRICVIYISSAGNHLGTKEICLSQKDIENFINEPSLFMGKAEYNKFIKENNKILLLNKQNEYYDRVNSIIDFASNNRDNLFINGSLEAVDDLIIELYDRTLNTIKKSKNVDSEEWNVIDNFTSYIESEINKIVSKNFKILEYYNSIEFLKLKDICETLMISQMEFNKYIGDKISSIADLFGTRVVRNETINDDQYNYLRPYKKTINPFTAEVSSTVFSSAENNPIDYVVKYFYPNKDLYQEQIQKLHTIIEELATLKEAKQIIENHKKEYQKYIQDVPKYILEEDEVGFYTRLGFANIDDSGIVVEYKFSYTSEGGMAKRTFTIPMTEDIVIKLIKSLESKLTITNFSKEQRALMTDKLRYNIKKRDNFTCCKCGISSYSEPNLLLEIDHIIPVSKGGYTVEDNLQTLCWKCNRSKGNKLEF